MSPLESSEPRERSSPWTFSLNCIYLFLERGEGKEKERERNINVWLPLVHPLLGTWPTTQARALTGNRTGDPLVCGLALSPLSHTSQGKSLDFKLLNVIAESGHHCPRPLCLLHEHQECRGQVTRQGSPGSWG